MNWHETRQFLSPFFPDEVTAELALLMPGELQEIRIRAQRPTVFVTAARTAQLSWSPDQVQLEALVEALSGHSLYARTDETGHGYITLQGGHRMGLCGRAAKTDKQSVLCDIGSVCIRIAGEWPGAADPLMTFHRPNLQSILIIGTPGSGKTSMLRDMARQLATGRQSCQTALVDERSELAACIHGIPQLDVGEQTDVLDGLSKTDAIPWLVRSMSPQMIITDELSSPDDAAAILEAMGCGIAVCASVHGSSLHDAAGRPAIASLMSRRAFDLYAVLSAQRCGSLAALHDRSGNPLPL